MKLITKEVEQALLKHPMRSQDGKGFDAEIVVKFFDPTGRWTYLVTEAEKVTLDDNTEDWLFFGYCVSPLGADCDEWGEQLFREIATTKGRFGLGMERDMHLPKGRTVGQEIGR